MSATLRMEVGALRPSVLTPPLSKSDAQRALVLCHLLGKDLTTIDLGDRAALANDVRVVLRGLSAIRGSAGEWVDIDCADGGAPFRLLLTQAAVWPGAKVRFTGTQRLGERPHRALFEALRAALGPSGLTLEEGNPWPVAVVAPTRTGEPVFRIAAAESSQYVSSLLFGAAALHLRERRPWRVELVGETASEAYLEMTVQWLQRAGFALSRDQAALALTGHAGEAVLPEVPGDWSSLGYLLPIAWKTGGEVARADEGSVHPDKAMARVLREVGLTVAPTPAGTLRITGTPRAGLTASGEECPDLLPTLAALACVLPAPSTLRRVEILRGKESDRLEGIRRLVVAAGGTTELEGTSLRVTPPARPPPALSLDSVGDHRQAMSAATLAVLTGATLTLRAPECVEKSFPEFWRQLEGAGARLTWAG